MGYIHSWILDEDDVGERCDANVVLKKLPRVVFVKFPGATWKLEGMRETGVYPICPVKRGWALDRHRRVPRLKIHRRQLPLAPAFAMTAHAAQGKTCKDGCIVDLSIGNGTDP